MTLREYFERKNSLSVRDMANMLNLTSARVRQIRTSNEAPPNIALKIERITQGLVSASDLSSVIKEARA